MKLINSYFLDHRNLHAPLYEVGFKISSVYSISISGMS